MAAPQLIGLSGKKRVGKDTFADALAEVFEYERQSFAEPIRQMLYMQNPYIGVGIAQPLRLQDVIDAMGWERAKDRYPEVRRLLQALGTQGGRGILGEDVWVDATMRKIDRQLELTTKHHRPQFVLKDCRFRNEAQAIVDRGGIVVRLERDLDHDDDHESETALDDWSFDYVIRNGGTIADLRAQAINLIAKERGEYTEARYRADAEQAAKVQRQFGDGPWAADRIAHQHADRIVTENGRTTTLPAGTSMFTVEL